ncbi:hypothetical protein CDAR_94703 [Caerostris darwini]|uniref:Glycosyl hydrolase family 31 C-terminal domain-containing protein n=1 Tax=Caerostris darwini TaxID=1538125 RepID=A0AAV4NWR9_9ARAC|nr:hypothetical protein CDAR_94703 [Caerostris darwini]
MNVNASKTTKVIFTGSTITFALVLFIAPMTVLLPKHKLDSKDRTECPGFPDSKCCRNASSEYANVETGSECFMEKDNSGYQVQHGEKDNFGMTVMLAICVDNTSNGNSTTSRLQSSCVNEEIVQTKDMKSSNFGTNEDKLSYCPSTRDSWNLKCPNSSYEDYPDNPLNASISEGTSKLTLYMKSLHRDGISSYDVQTLYEWNQSHPTLKFLEDANTSNIGEQFMWGTCPLIPPVLHEGEEFVKMHLPSTEWWHFQDIINHLEKVSRDYLDEHEIEDILHVSGECIIPKEKYHMSKFQIQRPENVTLYVFPSSNSESGEIYIDALNSFRPIGNKNYERYSFVYKNCSLEIKKTETGNSQSLEWFVTKVHIFQMKDVKNLIIPAQAKIHWDFSPATNVSPKNALFLYKTACA